MNRKKILLPLTRGGLIQVTSDGRKMEDKD
jgi:hypothetical protein